jgi:hypothetical protein
MKNRILLFLLTLASTAQANHITIGTGSGKLSQNGMTGLSSGDTLFITPGTYTGGNINGLRNIHVFPTGVAAGRVFFTGGLNLTNNSFMEFAYMTFSNMGGVFDFNNFSYSGGNINNSYFHNLAFYSCSGPIIDASNSGAVHYVSGDTTTYSIYKVTFDSIYKYNSGRFLQGSFGNLTSPENVWREFRLSHFRFEGYVGGTQDIDIEVRGVGFKTRVQDGIVVNNSAASNTGDIGTFYYHGSGITQRVYVYGTPSYVVRIFPAMESFDARDTVAAINCGSFNGKDYGGFCLQTAGDAGVDDDILAGKTKIVSDIIFSNNTVGDRITTINYWASMYVIGRYGNAARTIWPHLQIKNTTGWNLQTNGKPPVLVYQDGGEAAVGGNANLDTLDNRYFTTSTAADVSSSPIYSTPYGAYPSYKPNATSSLIVGKGVALSGINPVDYLGLTRPNPPGIGYLETTGGSTPPANIAPTAVVVTNPSSANITLPTSAISCSSTGSSDPDGSISSYAWSQTSGPSTATNSTPSSTTTNFSNLVAGVYVFKLTVTDNLGLQGNKSVTVTVNSAATVLPPGYGVHSHRLTPQVINYAALGIVPGDTVWLGAGSWPTFNLGGLNNIVFLNDQTAALAVKFTGNIACGNSQKVRFRSLNLPAGQFAFECTGTNFGLIEANGGNNLYDTVESFHTNASYTCLVRNDGNDLPYNGTPASAGFYGLTINNFKIDGSKTMVFQGTYDNVPAHAYRYMIGFTVSNGEIVNDGDASGNNNVHWRGFNTFGFYYHDLYIHGPTYNDRDAGMIWIDGGSGRLERIRKDGGWAYLARWWVVNIPTIPFSQANTMTYCTDTYNAHYGMIDVRSGYNDGLLCAGCAFPRTAGGFKIDHCTAGNLMDGPDRNRDQSGPGGGTYFSPLCILGDFQNESGVAQTVTITNCFAYNASALNPGKLQSSLLGRNGTVNIMDTSHNVDFPPTKLLPSGWVIDQTSNTPVVNGPLYKTATDGGNIGGVQTAGANQPPTAAVSGPASVDLRTTTTLQLVGSGTDPDGTIASYAWTVSGPNSPSLSSTIASAIQVTNLVTGTYNFTLVVKDNQGATGSFTKVVVVSNTTPANQAPTALVTPSTAITVQLPTSSTTLNGTASSDPDGTIVSYAWTSVAGGPSIPTIASPNSSATTITGLTAPGTYQIKLTVTDNAGATGSVIKQIVVTAANIPPVAAIAGPSLVVPPATSVALNSSPGTSDPDGSIVSYLWSQDSGPLTATNSTPTGTATVFGGMTTPGLYYFRLTVKDNSNATTAVTKTVRVNALPVANVQAASPVIVALPLLLDGSFSADPDGTTITYAWSLVSGPSGAVSPFASPTGVTTMTTPSAVGTYVYRLTVRDVDGSSGTFDKTVVVNPALAPCIIGRAKYVKKQ